MIQGNNYEIIYNKKTRFLIILSCSSTEIRIKKDKGSNNQSNLKI